jgi:hypothetical protein
MLSLDSEIREDREVEVASYGSDRVSDKSMPMKSTCRESRRTVCRSFAGQNGSARIQLHSRPGIAHCMLYHSLGL